MAPKKTLDIGIILAGLGKGKHKGPMGPAAEPTDEGEEPMGVSPEDYAAAAGEVRSALDGSDDSKLARALRAFFDLCGLDESEPEIEDED